ncbi:MAG: putative glycoside hydrolase [Patescibacteria group bacterium]|jgi:hypothetical protein
MIINNHKKILIFFLSLLLNLGLFSDTASAEIKSDYPKIANYYLQPWMPAEDADELYKYDLIILDADVDTVNPELIPGIKKKNPKAIILAYIPAQGVNTEDLNSWAKLRREEYKIIKDNDWWLKDSRGDIINFSNIWPNIKFVDPGKGWADYLSTAAKNELSDNTYWDGIFYDMMFANLGWLNNGDIDINQDGKKDDISLVNQYWQKQMNDLLKKTKDKIGGKLLLANVDIVDKYAGLLNGTMMENFPAAWLGKNGWSILTDQYVNNLPLINQFPNIYIINSNLNNAEVMSDFSAMRFGLTSTLLGGGYYSFDYGDQDHSQNWWYDEYDVNLGISMSNPYNLLNRSSQAVKLGLWRRDFEFGVSIVNSTSEKQRYIFLKEEFEKINGAQDRRVNNGTKVNYIDLEPKDGVVLLKIDNMIKENSFNNGSFVRVFNQAGDQTRNGFFSYLDSYSGSVTVLNSDIDNDGRIETLVNGQGVITIYKDGKAVSNFCVYDRKFNGDVSFAVGDLNGDGTKEIITGAGPGGGPQVRIFSKDGRPLTGGFFAYDKNFRGGVNVAVIDLNGDGTKEIITGAGPGGGPQVRVFSKDGRPLNGGFFAYDKNFRGGVDLAVGDLDGDGTKEIIAGAGPGGAPEVKIFSKDGKLSSAFMAYNHNDKNGIMVMSNDINSDKVDEILVSLRGN